MGEVPDPFFCPLMDRKGGDVGAVKENSSSFLAQEADDGVKKCSFTSAVRAKQPDDLFFEDSEGKPREDSFLFKVFDELLNFK